MACTEFYPELCRSQFFIIFEMFMSYYEIYYPEITHCMVFCHVVCTGVQCALCVQLNPEQSAQSARNQSALQGTHQLSPEEVHNVVYIYIISENAVWLLSVSAI